MIVPVMPVWVMKSIGGDGICIGHGNTDTEPRQFRVRGGPRALITRDPTRL
jgi:hypothetical protein